MKEFDLTTLGLTAGEHSITVVAKASGYKDSEPSNAVSYVVQGEETYTISAGTYLFTDELSAPNQPLPFSQTIPFTSEGKTYNRIKIVNVDGFDDYPDIAGLASYGMFFDNTLIYYKWDMGDGPMIEWNNQQNITVLENTNVSREFHDWFTANTLITFTIEGNEYQAKNGMTWTEWCESEYNTDGYEVIAERVFAPSGHSVDGGVVASDTIRPNESYIVAIT